MFNRNDFVSFLLPGYVNVLSLVIIFRPGLLTFQGFSIDLFSTVLLIVAGPALGITLRQFYRTAWLIYDGVRNKVSDRRKAKRKPDSGGSLVTPPPPLPVPIGTEGRWSKEYARIRLEANSKETTELENAEADMDFTLSTALGLFLQAIISLVSPISTQISAGLFIASAVLFVGGYFEWLESFGPTYNEIKSRHPDASSKV